MNIRAVRAFARVWAPKLWEHEYNEAVDAAFDAGEWSGGIHSKLIEEDWNKTIEEVAKRFGMTGKELGMDVYQSDMNQLDRMLRSKGV